MLQALARVMHSSIAMADNLLAILELGLFLESYLEGVSINKKKMFRRIKHLNVIAVPLSKKFRVRKVSFFLKVPILLQLYFSMADLR